MSTQRVTIDQAKSQLSDLIRTAENGGEVIIEQDGKSLARLIAVTDRTAYGSRPERASEFSNDEDLLAWDADGWENIA
jgi:prevent-host-death family protein